MSTNIKNIFYNNGNLNKNKLRESWILNNLPDLYHKIVQFVNINTIDNDLKFSNKMYLFFENMSKVPACDICNQNNKRFLGFQEGYDPHCSKKCAAKGSIQKSIETRKLNTLEKWGVEHTSQLPQVKEKQKNTNLQKWGFISPTLNTEVRDKQKKSMIQNWGVEYSGENKLLLEKSLKTRFNKYKSLISNNYPDLNIIRIPQEGSLVIKCNKCQSDYEIRNELLRLRYFRYKIETCLICNPLDSYKYTAQSEILKLITDNLNGEVIITGDRKILNGKEVDIFIPHLNLAIEFNGLWWHSELYKPKDYHLFKKIKCEEKNIQLIHIWEDDWIFKREIIQSRLLNKLGKAIRKIPARNCQIRPVSSGESKEFNDTNHLQGNINSSYKIGLYYKDELVSLMTFGKFRRSLGTKSKEGEWELYRFCNKLGTVVQGSFTKLLNHFESEMTPKKIITYANRDWSGSENIYEKAGFQFERFTDINYWYFKGDLRRHHRFAFRKDRLTKSGEDLSLSEKEIMRNLGWNIIWDCGNLKYYKLFR
jgi:hypothetical protein